ncbi:MAG: hypothetical protein ACRCXC_13585 [Legionella sp.]
MSDFKSKLPDLKELATMTSKLYTDIKKSVGEIVHAYKENRAQEATQNDQENVEEKPKSKAAPKTQSSTEEKAADENKKE